MEMYALRLRIVPLQVTLNNTLIHQAKVLLQKKSVTAWNTIEYACKL